MMIPAPRSDAPSLPLPLSLWLSHWRTGVVNINLGADTTFAWRHGGHTHRALIKSGDAIIFNGHQLEHAVEEIRRGQLPGVVARGDGRDCILQSGLQMRA